MLFTTFNHKVFNNNLNNKVYFIISTQNYVKTKHDLLGHSVKLKNMKSEEKIIDANILITAD